MDAQNKGISLDEFIYRKLQPVRILVNFLNNEMALNDGDVIQMERTDFDNIISTLEIFIEEYDRVSQFRPTRKSKSKMSDMGGKPGIKPIA